LLFLAAQPCANRIEQIRFRHRFGQIIIGARIHPGAVDSIFSPFAGEEDEWDRDRRRIVAQSLEDAVSVQFGHHDVAEDEVGLFTPGEFESGPAMLRPQRLIFLSFKMVNRFRRISGSSSITRTFFINMRERICLPCGGRQFCARIMN